MKTKKLVALILALCTLLTLFVMPAGATEENNESEIEIVILNEDVSEEAKNKIIAYYSNPNLASESTEEGATTYGLVCSVIGHNIDTSTVYTIAHKARATAPRCLRRTYRHEVCTRCDDYETSTILSTAYINCCA